MLGLVCAQSKNRRLLMENAIGIIMAVLSLCIIASIVIAVKKRKSIGPIISLVGSLFLCIGMMLNAFGLVPVNTFRIITVVAIIIAVSSLIINLKN